MTYTTIAAEAAWAAWRAGCSPIPVRDDGSKKPPILWDDYKNRRPTEAEMTAWFGPHRAAAVICGEVSGGLIMLEMEGADYERGLWADFRAAAIDTLGEDRWREITAVVEMSPSGGPHLLIRCTETTVGNLKLARRKTGPKDVETIMETRGEGGYTVIAGSVGHETGRPWTTAKGTWADITTVTADELHQILDAARTLDEMPAPAIRLNAATTERPRIRSGDSVFDAVVDDFNRRHTWDHVLSGTFEYAYERGRVTYWHRIGSDNETGATTNATGADTLIVFSSSTVFESYDGVGPTTSYDRFSAYAVLEHGGDRTAAYRALRDKGYGPAKLEAKRPPSFSPPPPLVDVETGEVADAEDDGPVPLDRFDLPKFPLDVLPKWMREEVVACAEAIQVPVEIPAALAVVAVSTAIAGKIDVDGINYRKPTNIYLCVVAASGVGKSPVAARMLGPLQELEGELLEAAQERLADARTEQKVIDEKHNAAISLLKKDPTSDIARRAVKEAELEDALHEVPAAPRIIIDDHTPEALVKVIGEQTTNRIAVLSPEGASLFTSMTGQRYKDASAPPEVPAVYLSAWDGEPITVDRVNRAPMSIKRPLLTVGALVQPVIVDRLSATPMVAQQGALARFLWVVARDNVGRRDPTRRRHAAPPSAEYADKLKTLARRCLQWQFPTVYLATEEAADFFDAVDVARERRMGLGGDLDTYRPVVAKLNGYQWRLAAILAAAHEDATGDGITLERAKQADRLADYFLAHSIAVHRRAGLDERGGVLRSVAAYLMNHAGEQVDWRDVALHMRGVVDSVAEIVPALMELEQMRWIVVHDGSLDAVGNRGIANPTVTVDARLRATRDGE